MVKEAVTVGSAGAEIVFLPAVAERSRVDPYRELCHSSGGDAAGRQIVNRLSGWAHPELHEVVMEAICRYCRRKA